MKYALVAMVTLVVMGVGAAAQEEPVKKKPSSLGTFTTRLELWAADLDAQVEGSPTGTATSVDLVDDGELEESVAIVQVGLEYQVLKEWSIGGSFWHFGRRDQGRFDTTEVFQNATFGAGTPVTTTLDLWRTEEYMGIRLHPEGWRKDHEVLQAMSRATLIMGFQSFSYEAEVEAGGAEGRQNDWVGAFLVGTQVPIVVWSPGGTLDKVEVNVFPRFGFSVGRLHAKTAELEVGVSAGIGGNARLEVGYHSFAADIEAKRSLKDETFDIDLEGLSISLVSRF